MAVLDDIYQSVIDGDMNSATEGVNKALEEGIAAPEILNKGLIAAMTEVGRLFEEGEYFVPEMLIAARAMQASVAILKPKLLEADIKPLGKVVNRGLFLTAKMNGHWTDFIFFIFFLDRIR